MQNKVKEIIEVYNLKCGYQIRYTDLVSEVGELGKELIKGSDYGSKKYSNTSNLELEIGDCLFSLFALCEELGIKGEDALDQVINKYSKRFEEKGKISS